MKGINTYVMLLVVRYYKAMSACYAFTVLGNWHKKTLKVIFLRVSSYFALMEIFLLYVYVYNNYYFINVFK